MLDIGILFLIILNQGRRLIGKGALADLIRLGSDRFTSREQETETQKTDRPHGDRTWHSMRRGGGLGPASRGVLEDAFGARVMDELPAGDQPLLHRHLAPSAKTIGEIMSGGCGS